MCPYITPNHIPYCMMTIENTVHCLKIYIGLSFIPIYIRKLDFVQLLVTSCE